MASIHLFEQLQRHFDHDCMRRAVACVYTKLGCTAGKVRYMYHRHADQWILVETA